MNRKDSLGSVRGLTVLITGAAAGMGAVYARRAHSEVAARLILWDIDGEGLDSIRNELRTLGGNTRIETQVVDLRDVQEIRAAAQAASAPGPPDILINNAGIVRGDEFWNHSPADIDAIMAVNALAPMHVTHAFLPAMRNSPRPGRIMTIASAAALVSNPNMSVYAASKAAAMSWSDSLRLELEREKKNRIKVTTICPTYVTTGMFAGARGPLMTPLLDPREVSGQAWNAMLLGTPLVLMPWTSKFGQLLRGVLPRPAWDFMADRVLGIYHSMDNFTGRNGNPGKPASRT